MTPGYNNLLGTVTRVPKDGSSSRCVVFLLDMKDPPPIYRENISFV